MLGALHFDFLICILHSVEVIDATQWYSLFSMVILPINSVINPLLYDDVVTNIIKAPARALSTCICNSTIFQRFRHRVSPSPAEDIELQQRDTDVGNAADATQKKETEQ